MVTDKDGLEAQMRTTLRHGQMTRRRENIVETQRYDASPPFLYPPSSDLKENSDFKSLLSFRSREGEERKGRGRREGSGGGGGGQWRREGEGE